jgi:hypothetical protein
MWIRYMPAGRVGNAANVGVQTGRYGSINYAWRHNPNDINAVDMIENTNLITGGFVPFVGFGWGSTGAEACDWTMRIQWKPIRGLPAGTYP